MLFSDIIEMAANEMLWDGVIAEGVGSRCDEYVHNALSCDAVLKVYRQLGRPVLYYEHFSPLFDNAGGVPWGGFAEFKQGTERQSVRHAWLMLLAQFVRDEGLDFDVEARPC